MPRLTRRGFLAGTGAALGARTLPTLARPRMRIVLQLVYNKAAGGLRAVEKLVPF